MTLDVSMWRLSLAVVLVGACYNEPKPACGFRCGPAAECPDGYTCGADNRCRVNGAPAELSCPTPDASGPYSPSARLVQPTPGTLLDPHAPIVMAFDVPVDNVTTTTFVVVRTGSNEAVPGIVDNQPADAQATFRPADGVFPEDTQLTIFLDDRIVDPVTSRPLRPSTFAIATGEDTTPPMVESTLPSQLELDVPVGVTISAQLSEPVVAISETSFTLSDGAPVQGTVTYEAATRTARFDPLDQLLPNRTHEARLSAAIMDVHGNVLAQTPYTWTFTTGDDMQSPRVRAHSPVANTTDVPVNTNIVITFDEAVQNVTTATFEVQGGAFAGTVTMLDAKTAVFDPTTDLPAGTLIVASLSDAITDTSGNPLVPFSFAFTTAN